MQRLLMVILWTSGLASSEMLIWDISSIKNLNLEYFPLTINNFFFSCGREKAIRKSQVINILLKSQF